MFANAACSPGIAGIHRRKARYIKSIAGNTPLSRIAGFSTLTPPGGVHALPGGFLWVDPFGNPGRRIAVAARVAARAALDNYVEDFYNKLAHISTWRKRALFVQGRWPIPRLRLRPLMEVSCHAASRGGSL